MKRLSVQVTLPTQRRLAPKLRRCMAVFFTLLSGVMTSSALIGCSSPVKYESREGAGKSYNASKNQSVRCTPYYRVVSGDSLSVIAKKCGVDMRALAKQNGLQFPYVIYAQQELSMPASEHHRTQSSSRQSLPSKTTANAQTTRQGSVPVANSSNSAKPSDSWQWPVNSTLEHRFIRDASGLSILEVYGVSGEDVRSVASGKVVYAGNGIINYGWMLVVKHDDDYMSIYAHNSALFVKEGDRVAKGQKVAELGATGNTTQSKLYLEARYQGRKIDVLQVLKK